MYKVTMEQFLNGARQRAINKALEAAYYAEYWGADYTMKHIKAIRKADEDVFCPPWIKAKINALTIADLFDVSKEKLVEMGFGAWNEESNVILIPLWIEAYLNDDEKLVSINGKEVSLADIRKVGDFDTRGGCLAYGFVYE